MILPHMPIGRLIVQKYILDIIHFGTIGRTEVTVSSEQARGRLGQGGSCPQIF